MEVSSMINHALPSTILLNATISSEASKRIVEFLIRNAHGGTLYSVLFGHALSGSMTADIRTLRKTFASGALDVFFATYVPPPHATVGDLLRAMDKKETSALETWFADTIAPLPLSANTDIDRRGSHRLTRFYDRVLAPHIVDKNKWSTVDTMLVVIILFSYHDFESALHERYANYLGAGVIASLQRYRLNLSAQPLSISSHNFDVAMLFHILHHVLPN